jgi:hypothetical protein
MGHQLSSLVAGRREPEPANNVVEPALEADEQCLTGDSLFLCRFVKVVGKLVLENSIDAFHLLFFAQLNPVSNRFGAMIVAMLSRREITLFDCAGVPEAAVPLQEELHPFPAAKPAFRFAVSSQFVSPLTFLQFQITSYE